MKLEEFLSKAYTCYHAAEKGAQLLQKAGFTDIDALPNVTVFPSRSHTPLPYPVMLRIVQSPFVDLLINSIPFFFAFFKRLSGPKTLYLRLFLIRTFSPCRVYSPHLRPQ